MPDKIKILPMPTRLYKHAIPTPYAGIAGKANLFKSWRHLCTILKDLFFILYRKNPRLSRANRRFYGCCLLSMFRMEAHYLRKIESIRFRIFLCSAYMIWRIFQKRNFTNDCAGRINPYRCRRFPANGDHRSTWDNHTHRNSIQSDFRFRQYARRSPDNPCRRFRVSA